MLTGQVGFELSKAGYNVRLPSVEGNDLRRYSSVGESAGFITPRSVVQIHLSPPYTQGTEFFCPFFFAPQGQYWRGSRVLPQPLRRLKSVDLGFLGTLFSLFSL